MTAKEGLKTKEYIELRMSDDKSSNVKGDSKLETAVRLTDDTAKIHEQIIPPFCRICFDAGSPMPTDNPLLRPCLCSGTTAAVHLICLQRWQAFSKSDSCELCKAPFNIPKELCVKQDVSPSDSPSVNHHPPMALGQCFRKLFWLIMLLCLQFIPIGIVVLIMTVPVEEQLLTSPTDDPSNISVGMFGRAILSVSVCLLYIPLLYLCLFKSRQFLNPSTSQENGRTRRYSSLQNNSYIWHRRRDERNHFFLEAAYI